MTDRSTNLSQIRPIISSALIYDTMSDDERFQNVTLRPIIEFQNELLVEVFKNYVSKHKNVFYALSLSKQLEYIENAVQKDMKFRNSLKGMVIGQFTIEEFEIYTRNSSSINKRIMNLIKERLIDHIQLFAPKVA